jgi:hypothetical protein
MRLGRMMMRDEEEKRKERVHVTTCNRPVNGGK